MSSIPKNSVSSRPILSTRRLRTLLGLAGLALVPLVVGCASYTYRMPYADGTDVYVSYDHTTHTGPPKKMYDLVANLPNGQGPASIVAAADGYVRFIQDSRAEPTDNNNFVWIEHTNRPHNSYPCPSGNCNEWTIYAHFVQNSVTGAANLSPGDWVNEGDFLGYEGDVGVAASVHLHWIVAALPPGTAPSAFTGYYDGYLDIWGQDPEIVPLVCHQGGKSVLYSPNSHTAAGCASNVLPPIGTEEPSVSKLPSVKAATPLSMLIERIALITDEGIAIAEADPVLMQDTQVLLSRLDPVFDDLLRMGCARMSAHELSLLLGLLTLYEAQASLEMGQELAAIRQQLESPSERSALGLIVEPAVTAMD